MADAVDIVYPIAVDFDGVLHLYSSPWAGHETIPDPPVEGAIEWLNVVTARFPVVIFTTRATTEAGREAIRRWLDEHGFTGVLHDITALKPPALFLLDDRAWRFEGPGTFPTVDDIRRAVPWWDRPSKPLT